MIWLHSVFLGGLDPSQSMIGQLAGFQIFSKFLDVEVIRVASCGLRGDIFDSIYDPLVFTGNQLGRRTVTTEFCSLQTGKLMCDTIITYMQPWLDMHRCSWVLNGDLT